MGLGMLIITKLRKKYRPVIILLSVWLISIESYANQTIEELWLSVRVNQQQRADTLAFLRSAQGEIWIAEQDWQQWRLKKPNVAIYQYNQQNYYNLQQIQGVSYQLNEQDLSIDITIPVSQFESLSLDGQKQTTIIKPSVGTGLFVNYDLSTAVNKQGLADSHLSLEQGAFHPWGIFNNQLLVTIPKDKPNKIIRLDSFLQHNDIESLTTFKIGDFISNDLGHVGAMRMAGIQRTSNFRIQPQKVITPVLTMSGEASLPSTVDVFINNMLTVSQKVPIGAFDINNIPAITGKGEASMVIKDMLGREQRVYLPYYINPEALQVGLHEYAYDIGLIRENYGLDNDRYDRLLANIFHRVGLTEYLTGELQVAATLNQQNLSYGAVFSVANKAAMQILASHSHHQDYGNGHSLSIDFATQLAKFNINNHVRWQSEDFAALSRTDNMLNSQFNHSLFVGRQISKSLGSLALAYQQQQLYEQSRFQSLQLNYNANLNNWLNLSASLTKVLNSHQKAIALLSCSIPLGQTLNANLQMQPQSGQQTLSVQNNQLSSIGMSYSLQHAWGNTERTQANLSVQNNFGQYRVNASHTNGDMFVQTSASGGIALLDKHLFFSRRINNSFAVVKVGDYPDIKIYKNNQLVGTTNQQGMVLVPQLLAYQQNKLRIEAGDLPFDVIIPSLEKIVVPAFRSGLRTDFAVKRAYGATMTLQLANKELLPAGAIIQNLTTNEQVLVGFNGQAYLTNLQNNNKVQVNWHNNQCEFNLLFKPTNDGSVPDLGAQICQQVQP